MESESEKRGELSPQRLAEKLKRIRADYGLTQGKMLLIINPTESDESNRARVSQYENGIRVPSLVEVYNYARFAGITVETLLNDSLDLPATMQQSNGDSRRDETAPIGNKAKNTEIEYGDGSLNNADVSHSENASKLQELSSSEARTVERLQTQGDACNKRGASSPVLYLIRLSEEISESGKAVFLKLLGDLPFNKMGRITPEKFVEQSIAAGLDDYHTRHEESALARRLRLLFENETDD